MDSDHIPRPEDHLGLLIHVKLCGGGQQQQLNQVSFNRIFERLRRIDSVHVSENPPRTVVPNFVVSLQDLKTTWGEFQQHRKIIGLICVGFENESSTANGFYEENSSGMLSASNGGENGENATAASSSSLESSKSSASISSSSNSLSIIEQYRNVKESYRSTLVDARCVVIGSSTSAADNQTSSNDGTGILRYTSLDDAAELEHDVRDYVKALYWVLEGKRLDLSFEKLDSPPFPVAPDEEKFLVGIDRSSRAFRKRCIGRLRKQVADVTLMTGLPTLALESYNAAIDQLKSVNDWLWLAGAYEGYACAALVVKYGKFALESLASPSPSTSSSTLQRAPTFTPGDMKKAQHARQSSPASGANPAFARRSVGSNLRPDSPRQNATKLVISETEIEEKFKGAIENYQKFTFAACIEYECAFKATALYLMDRRYDALDEFVNLHCGRFLDENFKTFADVQKGQICNLIANIYKTIGFRRKASFFTRLSALFRLYLARDDPVPTNDYKQAYPLLLISLDGYRIPWGGFGGGGSGGGSTSASATTSTTSGGWPAVQVRALHETYVSALRANLRDAATRHLAHMIQVALENHANTSEELLSQFCSELLQLNNQFGTHNISTHLRLSNGAILPPVQLTRIPKLLSVELKALPAYLAPSDVPDSVSKAIFIYSPFQTGFQNTQTRWVSGCTGAISVRMQNLLPLKLEVKNLILIGEGVSFDPSPTALELLAKSGAITIDLYVTPREAGMLTITGFSCEVLGVKIQCRFDDIPWIKRTPPRTIRVEVLSQLPELELSTSMRRGESQNPSELTETCSAEITLYAGQRQTEIIHLANASDLDIERIEWELQQPNVFGGTPLITVREAADNFELPFLARTMRDIHLCVTAVDPLTIEADRDENKKMTSEEAINAIPYTGRILTATVKFLYCGRIRNGDLAMDSPGKLYQRCCALTIFVTILPMVVVIDWHVLSGETSNDRYIALDVVNAADYEVDIHFPIERTVTIQPKDVCRVPVLCECCDLTSVTSTQLLRGPRAKHYVQDARSKYVQEHVRNRLKVGWSLTSNSIVRGDVPIGTVLRSTRLCKELVMSFITMEVTIAGASGVGSKDEFVAGVGERVTLTAKIVQARRSAGRAVANFGLQFFQDYQNGLSNAVNDDVLSIGSTTHSVTFGGEASSHSREFQFLFCNEGNFKVTVTCDISRHNLENALVDSSADDIDDDLLFGAPILPVLSINVISKNDVDVP